MFVGYAFDSPAWLVYNPVTRRVIRSLNVVFDEDWMKVPSISLPPQADEDEGKEEVEGTVPFDPDPFHVHQDPVEPGEAPPEELPDPPRWLQRDLSAWSLNESQGSRKQPKLEVNAPKHIKQG